MRTPVWRSASMIAQVQNPSCSTLIASMRVPRLRIQVGRGWESSIRTQTRQRSSRAY
ncbi:hypothetical protein [uncultured Jatrophihabitans sp.]|uniref:hypothetical protein n=1 Tax=uncultured Jatrophihabitans sp. TaxID=1610747 RepID=UPI0035CAAF12